MDDRSLPRGIASAAGPVTVHFDGACQATPLGSVATFGFTVEGGGFDFEDSGLCLPPGHVRATNNVAEYMGAVRALEWLSSQGYGGAVVVEGDSQLVVRQMTGEYHVEAEHLVPYHEWLKDLARRFASVEFRWVRREENARADALTKQAVEEAVRVAEARDRASRRRPVGP